MGEKQEALRRAQEYAQRQNLVLVGELGFGMNGVVWVADTPNGKPPTLWQSAVKACHRESEYCRERDVYVRLKEKQLILIRACEIPQLLGYDDDLWIIQMTIVSRPFCLDFGGAYLEKPPDFSEEVMADWQAEKIEQFGKHWPEVQAIIAVLEVHGIYLLDVHPKNISFAD